MIDLYVKMYASGSINKKRINLGKKDSSGVYKLNLIVDPELEKLNKFIVINQKAFNINKGIEITKELTRKNMEVYFILSNLENDILKGETVLKSDILKLEVK